MTPPRTAQEWDAEANLHLLLQCYRGRGWHARLRLFAVQCCRRIWDLIPPGPGGQGAVETAERFAHGQASAGDLRAAATAGAQLVDAIRRQAAAGLFGGMGLRLWGTTEEYAASAAWGCTFSGHHPALVVPRQVTETIHLRRYQEANHGLSRLNVWSPRAETEGLAAVAAEQTWQVTQLRNLVGNPFAGGSPSQAKEDSTP